MTQNRQVVRCKNSFHLKVLQDLFLNKYGQELIPLRPPIQLPNWVQRVIDFFENFLLKALHSSLTIGDFHQKARIFSPN
jgi:hypothetical protein